MKLIRKIELSAPIKYLVVAMTSVVVMPTTQADVQRKQIGDLEIYNVPNKGAPRLMMMLDVSGSMGDSVNRTGCIDSTTNRNFNYTFTDTDGKSFTVNLSSIPSCTAKNADGTTFYRFNRINTLKNSLLTLLTSNTVSNDTAIGIGIFSYKGNGKTGAIMYPIQPLDFAQRKLLAEYVITMQANGGTPTPQALSEAGAYMLGSNTSGTASGFANSSSATKSGSKYAKGAQPVMCAGNGIYLLTDGEPNTAVTESTIVNLMNTSLANNQAKITSDSNKLLSNNGSYQSSSNYTGWSYMAAYAQILNADNNAVKLPIKTATVGFGSSMAGLSYTTDSAGKKNYNCDSMGNNSGTPTDVGNLCRLGKDYGKGGYYYASTSQDVIDSLNSFIEKLGGEIGSKPSGVIVVPDDPYQAASQRAVAYYPILDAKVKDQKATWPGNLKKYNLDEGTLYGNNAKKLFSDSAGNLDPTVPDLWSDKDYPNENSAVTNGGFYAQLKSPVNGLNSVRAVYVEDWDNAISKVPKLKKFAVNTEGKVTLDGIVLSSNNFVDTATYTEPRQRALLSFLGFVNLSTTTNVKDMTLTTNNIKDATKVLGGTIHSVPVAISYSATLDDDGRVTNNRDDYVLFGSSDGALHMVNADNYGTGDGGKELFSVITRQMLLNQYTALANDNSSATIGKPAFGVDAPWVGSIDYKYDFNNRRVNVSNDTNKGAFAYGGLRMGGEALYGLNLTNKDSPSLMFAITPDTDVSGTKPFNRMGQIWAKPTKAKIKTSTSDKGTDVLVFGGGYDMKYEAEDYVPSANNMPKGNAVYIISAKDQGSYKAGDLIWSASSSGNPKTTVSTMTNSVVAGVTVLDRNNDGFMDHIYFADMGGQVFRADFTNAGFKQSGTSSATSNFTNTRVTRILKPAHEGTKYMYRFYERPVVSFYRNATTNSLFALINVISGDRSSPLSKMRNTAQYTDRVYGIFDNDITKADNILFSSDFTSSASTNGQAVFDLVDSNLVALPFKTTKQDTLAAVKASRGWYYPLSRFDGFNNVLYNKGVGKSEVINSFLYTTVYNPDMAYSTQEDCTVTVKGASERELYCLPYGICMDDTSKTGTGGFARAGQGIQELIIGPRSDKLSNQRILVGTSTLLERANNRVNYGNDSDKNASLLDDIQIKGGNSNITQEGGDGSAAEMIFNERFVLTPNTWFEVNQ